MYMYDENGTPYLDFYAGIAVNAAGNCNEKVVKAVQEQAADLMQTFNYPYTIPQALLAEKVCTTIGMDKIFYQNRSGMHCPADRSHSSHQRFCRGRTEMLSQCCISSERMNDGNG